MDAFTDKCKFKLKGTGPITFHLGCDFAHDEDGVPCIKPKKFIKKMCSACETHFGVRPQHKVTSPLEPGDHPKTNLSPLLNDDDVHVHQSLIGTLQWAASLTQFDIASAVMTVSSL